MVVGRSSFEQVLGQLFQEKELSFDTETTGLRPYHGDRLFSLAIATAQDSFYFNFQAYPGLDPEYVLTPYHLEKLSGLFAEPNTQWYGFNAKFDLAMLKQEGIELAGSVHCAKVGALLEYNEHLDYDLESCAKRIGLEKDTSVEEYISKHQLTEKRQGPTKLYTHKFYDRVPFEIISKYAGQDARLHFDLARHQAKTFEALDSAVDAKVPKLMTVVENERRLTKTVFNMESRGVKIDRKYCERAERYEQDRTQKAKEAFERETGRTFDKQPSMKLLSEVFSNEKHKWVWNEPTKTGQVNPSFESDVLAKFDNPAARAILEYRDAKSKADFYHGFLYHADRDDVVHPNFNPDGAAHGRFSSSNPNFQNLTSEEDEEALAQEFVVRRAIIPRPGFIFIMPDWSAMEYRMMFDLACKLVGYESEIAKQIKQGKDPHQATADAVTAMGTPLTRKKAKNGNFAWLYGSGYDTLAETIGGTRSDAIALKTAMIAAAPEVQKFVQTVINTARSRGWIFNWAGRRCHFPDPNFAYKATNYLVSGGCADVNKFALNQIDAALRDFKSKLVLTIHDENPVEVHESEVEKVPRIVSDIMENIYPYKYLQLVTDMEWSDKSLGDKVKGWPA